MYAWCKLAVKQLSLRRVNLCRAGLSPRRYASDCAGINPVNVGAPWDGGTTNRAGARHGPRQLRDCSTMVRAVNGATGVAPFTLANCADLGDIAPNPVDFRDNLARFADFYARIRSRRIVPLTADGDHLVSLPILRGLAGDGPLGMIHFDAHTNLFDTYFGGYRYTHGTPFRRAIEEGLLDPSRVVQIGIRGTSYDGEDIAWVAGAGCGSCRSTK